MAATSIASICSVTFIDPNSAPIPDDILPAQIRAVITGAISLIKDSETMLGIQDSAPNFDIAGLDWMVNTSPIIKPVMVTNGKDL